MLVHLEKESGGSVASARTEQHPERWNALEPAFVARGPPGAGQYRSTPCRGAIGQPSVAASIDGSSSADIREEEFASSAHACIDSRGDEAPREGTACWAKTLAAKARRGAACMTGVASLMTATVGASMYRSHHSRVEPPGATQLPNLDKNRGTGGSCQDESFAAGERDEVDYRLPSPATPASRPARRQCVRPIPFSPPPWI